MAYVNGEKCMSELQKAIEEITYVSKKFPQKAFDILIKNKEEVIPCLQSAIEKAIEKKDELEENYQRVESIPKVECIQWGGV